MGFFDGLFGGKNKVKKSVKILNDVTMNFMAKVSQDINAPTLQSMKIAFNAVGKDSTISGVTMSQKAKVSIDAAAKVAQSAELKQELVAKLKEEIKAKSESFSGFMAQKTDTDLDSVIDNSVTQNFTTEAIVAVKAGITQIMEGPGFNALDGGTIKNIKLTQEAEAVVKIAQDVSVGVLAEMSNTTKSDLQVELESKSFISNIFEGIAGIFGAWTQSIVIGIVALILGIFIIAMGMKLMRSSKTEPQYAAYPEPVSAGFNSPSDFLQV